jgi:Protein of unknown function (DUF3226)
VANRYLKRTTLYVEGRDDLHAIASLLRAHEFQMDDRPRDVEIIEPKEGDTGPGRAGLLNLAPTVVKASTDKAVGFVIDADASAAETWKSICHCIETAAGGSFKLPKRCHSDGVAEDIAHLRSRVGIWIMPDNSSAGVLEDFLQRLIDGKDRLLPIAKSSTAEAKKAGATFKASAEPKAVVHAWLAWQKNPGCPFGTAIRARYFDPHSEKAKAFVNWVRQLTA